MQLRMMVIALFLAAAQVGANAASLSLNYTGSNALADDGAVLARYGDLLTFELIMDFSEEPTIGGPFDIVFDDDGLQFVSYLSAGLGEPFFGRDPDHVGGGLLFGGGFGSFTGLTGPDLVATVTFLAQGPTGDYHVTPTSYSGPAGPFMSADLVTAIYPEFYGADVRIVPLPAAVWLMLCGIGGLAGFGGCRRVGA